MAPSRIQAEWEHHKETIRQLLSKESMTRAQVRRIMEIEHGFSKSDSQYQTQFKHWGVEFDRPRKIKNTNANAEYLRLHRILRGRKQDGKKSRVRKNGVILGEERVKFEISRHRCDLRNHLRTPPPPIHPAFTVDTPSPEPQTILDFSRSSQRQAEGPSKLYASYWRPYLELRFPPTLPVFRCERNLLPMLASIMTDGDYHNQNLFLSPSHDMESITTPTDVGLQHMNLSEWECSYLSPMLLKLIPSNSPGAHFRTSTLVERAHLGPVWCLRLLMYFIANNIQAEIEDEKLTDGRSLRLPDEGLLRLLQDSNISNSDLIALRKSGDLHALCFLEALFSSAVRLGDVGATARLLRTGANSEQLVDTHRLPCLAVLPHLDEIRECLDLGSTGSCATSSARPESGLWSDCIPAMSVAISSGNFNLALCLRKGGARFSADHRYSLYELFICATKMGTYDETGTSLENFHELVLQSFEPSREDLYAGLHIAMCSCTTTVVRLILQQLRAHTEDDHAVLRAQRLLAAVMVQDTALITELESIGCNLHGIETFLGWSPIAKWMPIGTTSSPLSWAIEEPEFIQLVTHILTLGADINWGWEHQTRFLGDLPTHTALAQAVSFGLVTIAEVLLQNGADPNPPGRHRSPYLLQAIRKGLRETAQVLLKWGARTTSAHLTLALEKGWEDTASQILECGVDIQQHEFPCMSQEEYRFLGRKTPLSGAISGEQCWATQSILERFPSLYDCRALFASVVKSWIESGDSPDDVIAILSRRAENLHPCIFEGAALGVAAARADWDMVRVLENHGIDSSRTPEAFDWHLSTLNTSLEYLDGCIGCPSPSATWRTQSAPEPVFFKTSSPLRWAVRGGSGGMIRHMLHQGAVPDYGSLVEAVERGRPDLVEMLLKAGADVNQWKTGIENVDSSCLKSAVSAGNISMVHQLLTCGAEVDESQHIEAWNRETAFQVAVTSGNVEIVETLLSAGANVNEPSGHSYMGSALVRAVIGGSIALVKRLLDLGADVHTGWGCHDLSSPLEAAASFGRLDIANLLLGSGVRTTGPHLRSYIRAVKQATVNGYTAIVSLLRRKRPWSDEDERLFDRLKLDGCCGSRICWKKCCDEGDCCAEDWDRSNDRDSDHSEIEDECEVEV